MSLSDTKVKNAKVREQSYKIADGKGLFLVISPTGSKFWRLRYYFGGKEKLLALGVYPDISLANARIKRDDARKLLANNIDPSIAKQVAKRSAKLTTENSFETIVLEWFAKYSPQWVPSHGDKIIRRFERDIFPWSV